MYMSGSSIFTKHFSSIILHGHNADEYFTSPYLSWNQTVRSRPALAVRTWHEVRMYWQSVRITWQLLKDLCMILMHSSLSCNCSGMCEWVRDISQHCTALTHNIDSGLLVPLCWIALLECGLLSLRYWMFNDIVHGLNVPCLWLYNEPLGFNADQS